LNEVRRPLGASAYLRPSIGHLGLAALDEDGWRGSAALDEDGWPGSAALAEAGGGDLF